jgi:DNA recombination protein RmuC
MLLLLAALQCLTLIVLVALLLRRPAASDPRAAQVPDQIARLEAHLDAQFHSVLADLRGELRSEAQLSRQASDTASATLRTEITASVTTLGQALSTSLNRFREEDAASAAALRTEVLGNITRLGHTLTTELAKFSETNTSAAEKLRTDVDQRMRSIAQSFADFKNELTLGHTALQQSLNAKLVELMGTNSSHQDKLRASVEDRLEKLNTSNTAKLEEMRQTVDEKLHSTLQTRLTESFGQVTDQLNKVHTGLGEMTKLSDGVHDLSRIFNNVKSRGGFAEVQLGMLLEQMLAPSQFLRNARVKEGSLEVVEYAVRFPGHAGETLLPIDAKFPREDWERLEAAYESGIPDEREAASKAFEAAIRTEGKRIADKYIHPPVTTPHAIMFLPTEGLYAEVMRRDSLQAEIQSRCHVTIAGPSTLSAILTSFQMGFHMLAIQEKGDEVWKVLEATKREFGTFETLMGKMESQVGTVQNTIQKLGVRTRAINRTLREVGEDSGANGSAKLISLDDTADGLLSQLAATSEDA